MKNWNPGRRRLISLSSNIDCLQCFGIRQQTTSSEEFSTRDQCLKKLFSPATIAQDTYLKTIIFWFQLDPERDVRPWISRVTKPILDQKVSYHKLIWSWKLVTKTFLKAKTYHELKLLLTQKLVIKTNNDMKVSNPKTTSSCQKEFRTGN